MLVKLPYYNLIVFRKSIKLYFSTVYGDLIILRDLTQTEKAKLLYSWNKFM